MNAGQILISLFMVMIVLIIFGTLLPSLNIYINDMLGYLSTADQIILRLFPTVILFTILSLIIAGKMADGVFG